MTPAAPPRTAPDDGSTAVTGDRFDLCVRRVLQHEGGFVDHPSDPGGATNWGISLRFLQGEAVTDPAVRARFPNPNAGVIRRLSRPDAIWLYRRCFWDRARCDALPPRIDGAVFDQAVNGGITTGVRLLQLACNAFPPLTARLAVDGRIGPRTLARARAAAERVGTPELLATYRVEARERYERLVRDNPRLAPFLRGWLRRADALGDV